MSNGIVLNHHSLPFASKEDADNGLLAFFNVLKVCRTAGLKSCWSMKIKISH